jgi:hypothetical protein
MERFYDKEIYELLENNMNYVKFSSIYKAAYGVLHYGIRILEE